jgi:hypothetical protein
MARCVADNSCPSPPRHVDALARGQLALGVLAGDALLAAHLSRQFVSQLDFLDFPLP